tara:strand:+ start:193 stop:381 length:189 start_codon:yes stop_codon:yes gene_type:complete
MNELINNIDYAAAPVFIFLCLVVVFNRQPKRTSPAFKRTVTVSIIVSFSIVVFSLLFKLFSA